MSDDAGITVDPVAVHVASVAPGAQLGAPAGRALHTSFETYVLTVNDPAQCILPENGKRISALVQPIDNDIVLGPSKAVVASPANTVASVPQPNGAYIPHTNTQPYEVKGSNVVFAGITTTASSSRVTVIATYRE